MIVLQRLAIRTRITIGSVVVAAAIFAIAMAAGHAEVVSILSASDRSLAAADLNDYATEIKANPGGLVDDSGKGLLVFIRDPRGSIMLDALPHDVSEMVAHRVGGNETFSLDSEDGAFVVVGRSVATATGDWSLWAARSTASRDLAMQSLDRAFLVGAGGLLALFGFASWLLAAAALRPVRRMRTQAESLGVESSAILRVGPAEDELSELATTLNSFLARVRASTAREKQVVSDAAHELRTPLSALTTQLELAHDDFADAPALAARVMTAEKSVARLSSLTANLLALSRLEAQPTPARASSAEELLSELMGCIDRARLIGLAGSVEVGFSVTAVDAALRFAISPENFARLADNLLANSIAAVPRYGAVNADLSQSTAGLVLRITDTGPGMPDAFLPHAFERFSRPDDSRTAGTGGSGLGLALVQAITIAANGTVAVHNTDTGFVATVEIPHM